MLGVAPSDLQNLHRAIVFNVDQRGKLLSEISRAFLRHAVRWWYAAMTAVKEQGSVFIWQHAFLQALKGFRSAAIRWALDIRKHFTKREHTHLMGEVAESTRERFNQVVAVGPSGLYDVTHALTQAIEQADAAYKARIAGP